MNETKIDAIRNLATYRCCCYAITRTQIRTNASKLTPEPFIKLASNYEVVPLTHADELAKAEEQVDYKTAVWRGRKNFWKIAYQSMV